MHLPNATLNYSDVSSIYADEGKTPIQTYANLLTPTSAASTISLFQDYLSVQNGDSEQVAIEI